jgi:anthranilate phosphoribosyltransferase
MNLSAIIKEVARGAHGARDLAEEDACSLYAAMLDGKVPDMELGALLIAFRIKGESLAETLGFQRAMAERTRGLRAAGGRRVVLLPSYNGARKQPNLTPLLALMLARRGVPVLIHGVLQDFGRVTTASILQALGVAPCATVADAQSALDAGRPAFLTPEQLVPGLERLLATRSRLGLRSSSHTLAKLLDPFDGAGMRVVSVTHPDYMKRMREFLLATRACALLMRGTEGEPVASTRRRQAIEYFRNGESSTLVEQGESGPAEPGPAALDAAATAAWIDEALAGTVPIPAALSMQVSACLVACGMAPTLSEAAALA